jgi:peroxiredoxin
VLFSKNTRYTTGKVIAAPIRSPLALVTIAAALSFVPTSIAQPPSATPTTATAMTATPGTATSTTARLASSTLPAIAEQVHQVQPLLNGMTVPAISLQDEAGNMIDLGKQLRKAPSIVVFFRGGWCPYCNAQLAGLQTISAELSAMGYQIIAISPETLAMRQASMAKNAHSATSSAQRSADAQPKTYLLYGDVNFAAMRGFGIAYYQDDKTTALYKNSYGITLSYDSNGKAVLPAPAVFILNQNAEVQFSYVHINYKTRLQPQLLTLAARLALPSKS